ncbi:MAG TPA: GNAT family N-acetyltransferase, partial [Verrucomicrobiae bacterium]|nr:GNAT family N-acetyltransferase [Verrucomicrobiae bacterium]
AAEIAGRTVIVKGGWFKIASVRDEELTEGDLVSNPVQFVTELKRTGLKADVLTFFQRPPDVTPRFPYEVEWENYAVVPTTSFEGWWEKLPQEARKNTRRAAKRGVTVKAVSFDDEFARGIHKICNEAPIRQGRRFWHYGKDFEAIKREHGTYVERSEFIGAYFENELIGFVKMTYVDKVAFILSIIALNSHQDKRPMNALVTKAVEICAQKGVSYLVYGNYIYGNKKEDSLVEFKRRNGFERLDFPRYYVPLTLKGRLFNALKLHRGPVGLLPGPLLRLLLKVRAHFLESGASAVAAQDA